jgi:TRAP-type C4-dicarboxylate transport system substrate-binding protein
MATDGVVRSGLVVAAVAGLLAVAGCGGATDKAGGTKRAPVVVLKVLNTRGAQDMQPYTDRVAQLSGGAVRLTGDEKWGLASATAETDAIRAVRVGQADLAIVPTRAWHEVGVTSFDALVAPLAVDSMALQAKVLASDLPAQMLAGVTPLGLTGIGILPGPMRKPAGITRALRVPSDYRGTTIAYSRSAVADRALRALGATPVASAFERADISAFDGTEQQVSSVAGNEYDGTVRTITENVNLWPRSLVIVGNTSAMQRLTDQQTTWLRTAAGDVLDNRVDAIMKEDTDATAFLCRRARLQFVATSPDQAAQLRSAFQPVYAWLRQDQQTSRYLDRVAALRAGLQPFPQESLGCTGAGAAATASAAASTGFDGTYQVVVTQQEWRKADPEHHPENWGTYNFVFGHGRFAFTQENKDACTWAYGGYVVTGQRVAWSFLDGGGIAPTNAQNKAGEEFIFSWNRYRDTMTLKAISPPDVRWKPWHQVSATPTGSHLSKKCPPPAQAGTW